MTETKLLAPAFFISILLHVFMANVLKFNVKKVNVSPIDKKQIKVTTIDQNLLKKYRTVGVKGGKKHFTMKTPRGNLGKGKVQNRQKNKAISMKDLKAKNLQSNEIPVSHEIKKLEEKKQEEGQLKILSTTAPRKISRTMMKQLATSRTDEKILSSAGFNLQFSPPEGVSEDQLNSTEKIYYAFQKRTFQKYVASFVKSYNEVVLERPYIKGTLQTEKHILTGKVMFDKEGNIISIKMIKWSHDDGVQKLFEKTLKEIRAIPNPPKSLLDEKEEFYIYYQLHINS